MHLTVSLMPVNISYFHQSHREPDIYEGLMSNLTTKLKSKVSARHNQYQYLFHRNPKLNLLMAINSFGYFAGQAPSHQLLQNISLKSNSRDGMNSQHCFALRLSLLSRH